MSPNAFSAIAKNLDTEIFIRQWYSGAILEIFRMFKLTQDNDDQFIGSIEYHVQFFAFECSILFNLFKFSHFISKLLVCGFFQKFEL